MTIGVDMNKSVMPGAISEKQDMDLRPFFSPVSVAVIGASPKRGSLGTVIVDSLLAHGFRGEITTVHPQGLQVSSVPVVRSVDELPGGVDLAIAAVSASNVPGLVESLAKKGIRHLIVISGGFAETGEAGRNLQEELRTAGQAFGVRIIGPNGLGVFSAPDCFNSFFLFPGEFSLPKPGPIAIISQSGALLSLLLDRFSRLGVGVRRAVNFGNRVDVGECELIEEFARDPDVKVIGLYLESIQDGKRFVEVVRKVTTEKPVVIWKGGHEARGGDAVRAHSASLAGSYAVFQAACAATRMLEVYGFQEFSGVLQALALQPPARGNRVLIVSNGGGMGVFLTDLCERSGFTIPVTPEALVAKLKSNLPDYYSLKNPIDLTGSGTNEQCAFVVEQLLRSGEFDCLLMVLLAGTAGITPDIARLLKNRLDIPIVMAAYGRDMLPRIRAELPGVPVLPSAEEATKALKALVHRSQIPASSTALKQVPIYRLPENWKDWLNQPSHEMQNKIFLRQCGVQVPGQRPIRSVEDIEPVARELGFPMVLKIVEQKIRHKTEVKGIRLDLSDKEDLAGAWEEMSRAWPGMVWAEQQLPPGLDLMIGAHRDPQFGPVLVFGTGGQYVEIYKDIERVLIPADDAELLAMVCRTRAGQIAHGVRGNPPLAVERLIAFLRLISDWMVGELRLESMDFNPVRLYKDDLVVLDAKIVPM